MTGYPIPDELRDQFLEFWYTELDLAVLDRLADLGFHIEQRLPEFAVHDDTCCGGSGWTTEPSHDPDCDGMKCERLGCPVPIQAPCPGVGYYHWTAK